jgi:hypothetical protein
MDEFQHVEMLGSTQIIYGNTRMKPPLIEGTTREAVIRIPGLVGPVCVTATISTTDSPGDAFVVYQTTIRLDIQPPLIAIGASYRGSGLGTPIIMKFGAVL